MDLVDLAAVLQEELGGRPSRGLVRAIADASGGNPLLARVAAAQLGRTGQIVERDDGLVSTGPVPEAVAADIHAPYASAIESLPADTREVLSTLAVLGDQASIADLTAVTGRTPSEVIEAVVAAEDLVLVRLVDERVQFSHELVRRSVLVMLGESRRQLLHARTAEALSRQTPDPRLSSSERVELIANQWERAGVLADPAVTAGWAFAAGVAAYKNTIWSEAARHLSVAGARGNEEATDLRIGQAKYYALDPSARAAFSRPCNRPVL